MTDSVPDRDDAEAPSALASLRARLGTISTLSQPEVDQLIARLRLKRQSDR